MSENTLLDIHKAIARLETKVELVTFYQKESNEKVDAVIKELTKAVAEVKIRQTFAQGFAAAFGFISGIIGAIFTGRV